MLLFLRFFVSTIKKAPLQLFSSSILIALFLGYYHSILATYLSTIDIQAYFAYYIKVNLWIILLETIGLSFFYASLYPLVKGYILAIGMHWKRYNEVLSIQNYLKNYYYKKAKQLCLISLKRFGFQTISLICLMIITFVINFTEGYFSNSNSLNMLFRYNFKIRDYFYFSAVNEEKSNIYTFGCLFWH